MNNKLKFSNEYYNLVNLYKIAHKNGIKKNNFFLPNNITFDGKSLSPWIQYLKKIIENTNSKSILDYGCGKAKFYNNQIQLGDKKYKGVLDYWGITEVKLFDPGIEEYDKYPIKNYDGVICTDVLEHIALKDLDAVVKDIFSFSNKFVFFVISTILDKKTLNDGRNVHQTVKNEDWWKRFFSKFESYFVNIDCTVMLTNLGEKSDAVKRII
tara:strand:+ start:490 stop:1122 length:633 start_codon:yes stop_codon:yes gene_type:complete